MTHRPRHAGARVPAPRRGRASGSRRDDLLGQTTVLVFYPVAFSPVCTDQFQVYEEVLDEFEAPGRDAVRRLVRRDVDSQTAFRRSSGSRSRSCRTSSPRARPRAPSARTSSKGGISNRALVIVDPDGVVQWSWEGEHPGVLPGANLIFDGLAAQPPEPVDGPEQLARLRGRGQGPLGERGQLPDPLDERRVRGRARTVAVEPDVVLQPDPDVPAGRQRQQRRVELVAADAGERPDPASGDLGQEGGEHRRRQRRGARRAQQEVDVAAAGEQALFGETPREGRPCPARTPRARGRCRGAASRRPGRGSCRARSPTPPAGSCWSRR